MYNRLMHRTQLYIDETLASEIQQVATIQHRSAAAVIRDAVRTCLASVKQEQSDDPFLPIIGAYTGGRQTLRSSTTVTSMAMTPTRRCKDERRH